MAVKKNPRTDKPTLAVEDTFHSAAEEERIVRKPTSYRMDADVQYLLKSYAADHATTVTDLLHEWILTGMGLTLNEVKTLAAEKRKAAGVK